MGNLQVRFLEGWAPAMAPGYSTLIALKRTNPFLEPRRFGFNHALIVKSVGKHRYALSCGQKMHCEPARIGSFAQCLELRLHPSQGLREQCPRSLRNCAAVLLQFGAQRSDRTAAAGQPLAVLNLDLHKAAQPLLGRICFVQHLQRLPKSRNPQLDDDVSNLVFSLKVILDIPQRNPGHLSNIREGRAAHLVSGTRIAGSYLQGLITLGAFSGDNASWRPMIQNRSSHKTRMILLDTTAYDDIVVDD